MKTYENAQLINQVTLLVNHINQISFKNTNIGPSLNAANEFLMNAVKILVKNGLHHYEKETVGNQLLLNFKDLDQLNEKDLKNTISLLFNSDEFKDEISGLITHSSACFEWIKSE